VILVGFILYLPNCAPLSNRVTNLKPFLLPKNHLSTFIVLKKLDPICKIETKIMSDLKDINQGWLIII